MERSSLPGTAAAVVLLVLLSLVAVGPAVRNGFVNYDDDIYVVKNQQVRNGLTGSGLSWAFTTTTGGNWHPLTWISHMADVSVHGLDPAGHHRTSVIFHALNSILVFAALFLATRARWRSFFAVALFAVHPLHVESVAWVAERKDVLSGFFWLLSILLYFLYVRRPSLRRFLPVALSMTALLLSKPMGVTLPFALLLLDFWPLERFRPREEGFGSIRPLIREKVPLFLLSLAASVVTWIAQSRAGAIAAAEGLSFAERVANAVVSYAVYLEKMFMPRGLAVFYPFSPEGIPWFKTALSLLALGLVSGLAWRSRKGWFLSGWLWYLGTLVPVIGLVRVGSQAMADRYTYLPSLGIFWIIAWGAGDLARRGAAFQRAVPVVGAAAVIFLALAARAQTRVWESSETLFRHALAVAPDNTLARLNLGEALASAGKTDEALGNFRRAVALYPGNYSAQNDLGLCLAQRGQVDSALACYREAIRLQPDFPEALYNLGNALLQKGRAGEAVEAYRRSLARLPEVARVHNNLGNALVQTGDYEGAEAELKRALELDPTYFRAWHTRANLALRQGRAEEGLAFYREVLKLKPDYPEIYYSIGMVYAGQGRREEAVSALRKALELRPSYREARQELDSLLRSATP